MIGIDTNVLIRYITQDDVTQSRQVNKFIETTLTAEHNGLISKIVLCELSWVLDKAYGYSKEHIISVIQQVIITQEFTIEDSENALRALQFYRKGSAGFADYFLALTHRSMGAEYTITFDKQALKDGLFHKV